MATDKTTKGYTKNLGAFKLRKEGSYIVVAKRYSKNEAHSYIVDLCKGINTAKDAAEKEMVERAGSCF